MPGAACLDLNCSLITVSKADAGVIFLIFITLRGLRFRDVKSFSLIVFITFFPLSVFYDALLSWGVVDLGRTYCPSPELAKV